MRRPLLLAHRGAHRRARENTIPAFDQALADGCDGFEFDVRRTADGHGIICHDASFQHLRIARHTFNDLFQRESREKANGQLCCVEDVLRRYSDRAFLEVELKDAGLEDALAAAIREYRPKRYLVSSFLPEVITAMCARAPDIPLGLIADTCRGLERWRQLPVSSVIVHRSLLSARLLDCLHAAGKQVFVWTVNRQREMLRFAEWGVDGIVSDDTELLSRTFPGI